MSRESNTPDVPTTDATKSPSKTAAPVLEVELDADSFLNLSLEEQCTGSESSPLLAAAEKMTALSTVGLEWVGKGTTTSRALRDAEIVTGQFLDRATLLESGLSRFVTCPNSLRRQAGENFVVAVPNPALRHATRWCQCLKAEQALIRVRVASSKAIEQVFDGPRPGSPSESGMNEGDDVLVAQQGVWRRGRIKAITKDVSDTTALVFLCVLDGMEDAVVPVSRNNLRHASEDSLYRAHKMDATARASKFSESFPLTVSINLSLAVLRSAGTAGSNEVLEAALQSLFELLADAADAALFNLKGRGAVVSFNFNCQGCFLLVPN